MTVKVRFFASLAETVGRREADVEFDEGLTVASVWQQVTGEQAVPEGLLCAVNQGYCEVGEAVADDDEVAFFPPVTGG
ncbi:MAG: MoaD/ThiS family protein [Gammaproteobacteria bacterium]